MKRILRGRGTVAMLTLGISLAVGACDEPLSPDPNSRPGPSEDEPGAQPAVAEGDRLPDLGMARLGDISVEKLRRGRRLLRYSTTVVNVGAGPFELRGEREGTRDDRMTVTQRILEESGGWRPVATDAAILYSGDGHDHWHVQDLLDVRIVDLGSGIDSRRSAKRGFCFWDNTEHRLDLPGAPRSPVYQEEGCGKETDLDVTMGQSVGWGDRYAWWLPNQHIDISKLRSGEYRLIVTADPAGWFTESDTSNNSTWVDLELRGSHVRVIAHGPEAR